METHNRVKCDEPRMTLMGTDEERQRFLVPFPVFGKSPCCTSIPVRSP
jgi:hypothetical protein